MIAILRLGDRIRLPQYVRTKCGSHISSPGRFLARTISGMTVLVFTFIYSFNYTYFSDPCTTFTFPDPYDYPDCPSFCIHDSTCTAMIKSVLSVTACNSRTTLPTVGTSSLAAPPPAGSTDLARLGDACSWPPEYVRRAWLSYLLRWRLRLC